LTRESRPTPKMRLFWLCRRTAYRAEISVILAVPLLSSTSRLSYSASSTFPVERIRAAIHQEGHCWDSVDFLWDDCLVNRFKRLCPTWGRLSYLWCSFQDK
jgi:hypothetical protein